MSTTTNRTPIESDVPQGWPALFAALPPVEPAIYYSLVSPERIKEARAHIALVLSDLRRIETHLRAYGCEDEFDQDNLATDAINELGLALAALAGGGA